MPPTQDDDDDELADVIGELDLNIDDPFIRKQLDSQLDLRDFTANVEAELAETKRFVVADCVKNAEELAELHNRLSECDQTFAVRFLVCRLPVGLYSLLLGPRACSHLISQRAWLNKYRHEAASKRIGSNQPTAA